MERTPFFGPIIGCTVSVYHLLSLTCLDCFLKGEQSKEQFAMLWQKLVGFQIQGTVTVTVIAEFLDLWDLVSKVELHPEVEDAYL